MRLKQLLTSRIAPVTTPTSVHSPVPRGRAPMSTRACAWSLVAALSCAVTAAAAEPSPAKPGLVARTMASAADASAEVVLRALSLLGVNYRYGGNTPDSGLDCSGLVKLVYHETIGMVLPRRSDDMSRVGETVPMADLQPGDLVFFNTMRFAFSHVGIYIGNGQFVHAPSRGKQVRVEELNKDYWLRRFDGGRRLLSPPPEIAALQSGQLSGLDPLQKVIAAAEAQLGHHDGHRSTLDLKQ